MLMFCPVLRLLRKIDFSPLALHYPSYFFSEGTAQSVIAGSEISYYFNPAYPFV